MKQQQKYIIRNNILDNNFLNKFKNQKVLFVCISNILRNDDGIGEYIYNRISNLPNIQAINAGTCPENYISKIKKSKSDVIIFIDSIINDSNNPGDIILLEENEIKSYTASTHSISLEMIINQIKRNKKFSIYLIGIQPENVSIGTDISETVFNSADRLISIISDYYSG